MPVTSVWLSVTAGVWSPAAYCCVAQVVFQAVPSRGCGCGLDVVWGDLGFCLRRMLLCVGLWFGICWARMGCVFLVFLGLPSVPPRSPEQEAPGPHPPREPEQGPSPGVDTFCQGKADGLYPNPGEKSSYYSCAGGRLFQQSCPPALVFSDSCKCCTWS